MIRSDWCTVALARQESSVAMVSNVEPVAHRPRLPVEPEQDGVRWLDRLVSLVREVAATSVGQETLAVESTVVSSSLENRSFKR